MTQNVKLWLWKLHCNLIINQPIHEYKYNRSKLAQSKRFCAFPFFTENLRVWIVVTSAQLPVSRVRVSGVFYLESIFLALSCSLKQRHEADIIHSFPKLTFLETESLKVPFSTPTCSNTVNPLWWAETEEWKHVHGWILNIFLTCFFI